MHLIYLFWTSTNTHAHAQDSFRLDVLSHPLGAPHSQTWSQRVRRIRTVSPLAVWTSAVCCKCRFPCFWNSGQTLRFSWFISCLVLLVFSFPALLYVSLSSPSLLLSTVWPVASRYATQTSNTVLLDTKFVTNTSLSQANVSVRYGRHFWIWFHLLSHTIKATWKK